MNEAGLSWFGVLKEDVTDCNVVVGMRAKVVNGIPPEDNWINYRQRLNSDKDLNSCQ
jgi:hypothetical protein